MEDILWDNDRIKKMQRQITDLKSQCLANAVPQAIIQQIENLEAFFAPELEGADDDDVLSAQVSIYPLRQASLSPIINEALSIFKKHGLEVIPGSMSTLIAGNEFTVWRALQKAFTISTGHGQVVMIVTLSNACPLPSPHDHQ